MYSPQRECNLQVEAEHNAALDACDALRDRMGEVAEFVSLASGYTSAVAKAAAARAAALGASLAPQSHPISSRGSPSCSFLSIFTPLPADLILPL